jgi:hypothetical protein
MGILLLTHQSSQRDALRLSSVGPTPPRLVPAGETDDGPRQVPDFATLLWKALAFTVAGTVPDFRRLPFEPSPPSLRSWTAPWSKLLVDWARAGCQIEQHEATDGFMTSNSGRLAALLLMIAAAAALRLVPHPPNFSPIDAMALFSGAYVGRRTVAFAGPLAALALSDLVLGSYPGMLFQYASVAVIVLLGSLALSRISVLRVAGASLASSVLFFVISNFGVWLVSGMYDQTIKGLGDCYVAAIPFFQNTLGGDLFYAALLFGGFSLLQHFVPRLRAGEAQPA